MSTSNPLPTIAAARAALAAIRPAFLRGTIPINTSGEPSLPDEAFVLDIITAPVTPDFTSEYATVQLQVGAWSTSVNAAQGMQASAEAALRALAWRLQAYGPLQDDGPFRGVVATYERLQ